MTTLTANSQCTQTQSSYFMIMLGIMICDKIVINQGSKNGEGKLYVTKIHQKQTSCEQHLIYGFLCG